MMKSSAGFLLPSLFFATCALLPAATFFWDADESAPFNQNGSGVWNTTAPQWSQTTSDSEAPSLVTWDNASHTAYLGLASGYTNVNVGGTLTLEEEITLGVLEKSALAGAYVIAGNGHSLTFTAANSKVGNNSTSADLTIDGVIAGTQGISKSLNGKVIFAADNTYSGGTIIEANSIDPAHAFSVLQIGKGGTSGTLGTGDVSFKSAGEISAQSVLAFNRSDEVVLDHLLISDSNGGNLGILRQAGTGILRVTGENEGFHGSLDVVQGSMVIGAGGTSGSVEHVSDATVAAGAILAFDRTDNLTFLGTLKGSGLVEKRNTGILQLGVDAARPSTHTGIFRVAGGEVEILGNQAASPNSTLSLAHGTVFDVGSYTQTFSNLVVENNATAKVVGTGTLILGASNWILGATALDQSSTLDLRELSNFRFEGGTTSNFVIGGNISSNDNINSVTRGIVFLAENNYIRSKILHVGTINGGGSSPKNAGFLYLGKTNTFISPEISIAGHLQKNDAGITFADDIVDGTLSIRGGINNERATLTIGRHNSGFVVVEESFLDTTAGSLDARLGTLLIGHNADAASAAKGRLSMGAGTLDATHIVIGRRSAASTANTSAVLELNGGNIKAENITFGDHMGTAMTGGVQATLRLVSGQLATKTLVAGKEPTLGTRKLEWISGTITPYDNNSNLTSSNVHFHLMANGTRDFNVAASRTITIEGNFLNETGATAYRAFTKNGAGTLILGGTLADAPHVILEAGTLRVTNSNRFGAGGSLEFAKTATFDLQSYQQTLSDLQVVAGAQAVIRGTAGSALHLVGGTGNMTIGGLTNTSLDMSTLSEFSFTATNRALVWGGQGNTANSLVTVKLASGSNSIQAQSLNFNTLTSGATAGPNRVVVELGQTNVLNISDFNLNGIKSSSTLRFADSVTDGNVTIRNTSGTGRANLYLGDNKSGGTTGEALADFSRGTVNALLNELRIGTSTNEKDQNKPSFATFKMEQGLVDVTTLTLGRFSGPNTSNVAIDTNRGDGTFILNGSGTLKAQTVKFAEKIGTGIGYAKGTLELTQGSFRAGQVSQLAPAGVGSSTILWHSGTIQNYDATTDANFQNVALTLQGNTGTRQFDVDLNRQVIVRSALVDGSAATTEAFTKLGLGTLELQNASTYSGNTHVAQGRLVAKNTLGSATGTGSISVANTGILAGSGHFKPTGNHGVSILGQLEVGTVQDTLAQTLTFDLGETTGGFLQTGTFAITLFSNSGDNTQNANASDTLRLMGIGESEIELSGTLSLSLADSQMTFAEGDRWKIASFEDNDFATLGAYQSITTQGFTLAPELAWFVERDLNGLYAVVGMIPEPNRALLVLFGLSSFFLRRRR